MPLLPTRPSIRLRAPRDVVPGRTFDLEVLLDAREPVDIDGCDLRVDGWERVGENSYASITPLGARVCGPRRLEVGSTALPCRMTLPAGAPRSKRGPGAHVVYDVFVHASVPWWPDTRAHFPLHVVTPSETPVTGTPRVGVSRIEGPTAGEPYAELSVSSDVVELGGVVDARVAMRDVGGAPIALALVAYETYGAVASARVAAWSIPASADGSFAFRVPDDLTPTMQGRHFALAYWLEAEANGMFGRLVSTSVPIRVVDRGTARSTARVVAPHVGDARLEELFAQVGASEGVVVEPGPTLVCREGAVVGKATRELGPRGTRIAVSVTYPSLHLGVHVHDRSLLARGSRKLAKASGLERCATKARDDEQAAEVLARLAGPLQRAIGVEMTDSELRYEIASSANDVSSLGRIVRGMREVVTALATPPPLPTALAPTHAAWTELARALDGELEPGHARIVARREDAAIAVMTLFGDDGVPNGTTVIVRPTREMRLDGAIALVDGPLPKSARVSADARAALDRLARFGRVHVDVGRVLVSMDVALGPTLPLSRAREIVDAALRLAAALRPTAGPFR